MRSNWFKIGVLISLFLFVATVFFGILAWYNFSVVSYCSEEYMIEGRILSVYDDCLDAFKYY